MKRNWLAQSWWCCVLLALVAWSAHDAFAQGCNPTLSPSTVSGGIPYTITANCSGTPNPGGYAYQLTPIAPFDGSLAVSGSVSPFTTAGSPRFPGTYTVFVSNTNGTSGTATLTAIATGACTPSVSPNPALPGSTITITANCSGTPNAGQYFYITPNGPSFLEAATYSVTLSGATAPGTYTIQAANSNGTYGTTTLTVASAASCSPTVSPNPVQAGQPYAITANCTGTPNANGYAYTGPGGLNVSGQVSPYTTIVPSSVSAGNYTVQASNSAGGSGSTTLTVTQPTFTCNLSANPTSVVAGASTTLATNCTFNGTPVGSLPNTTVTYAWPVTQFLPPGAGTGGAQPAPLPPASANASVVLPNAGSYFYQSSTTVTFNATGQSFTAFSNITEITANVNQAPKVTLTSATPLGNLIAPATIDLVATVTDPDTPVARVEFRANGALIGTGVSAGNNRWTLRWSSVARNTYNVTAIAFDSLGNASSQSAPLAIVVRNANEVATTLRLVEVIGANAARPGAQIALRVQALNGSQPVSRVPLAVRVENADLKAARAQKAGETCPADDQITPQPTGDDGVGRVDITLSCKTGGRVFVVFVDGNDSVRTEPIAIRGPDNVAQGVRSIRRALVIASTGTNALLGVRVVDAQGNPVAAASVNWSVVAGSGRLGNAQSQATSQTNEAGDATVNYALGTDERGEVRACLAGGTGNVCEVIRVASERLAVTQPAQQLVTPMTQTTVNAARTQLRNVFNRLERLRLEQSGSVLDGFGIKIEDKAIPAGPGSLPDKRGEAGQPISLFINGDVEIGKRKSDGASDFKLRTRGLTLGADYRLGRNAAFGAALGLLRGDTDLPNGAGSQDSKGYSVSLFGMWRPTQQTFVDVIGNFGRNDFDSSRRTLFDETATSSTRGTQAALQLNVGYTYENQGVRISPYGSLEHIRAHVDGFEERGGDALRLTDQRLRSTSLALGTRAEYVMPTRLGLLVPTARVEWLRQTQNSNKSVFAQLVGDTTLFAIPLLEEDRSYGNLGIGLNLITAVSGRTAAGFLNYERAFGNSVLKSDRYSAGFKIDF